MNDRRENLIPFDERTEDKQFLLTRLMRGALKK